MIFRLAGAELSILFSGVQVGRASATSDACSDMGFFPFCIAAENSC